MVNYTTSEENHIKAIFHLQSGRDTVTTNELARDLSTQPASVTDMMKKLHNKKLLHYQPYHGFRLSNQGKKVALGIIRRHRLWEYFLAEKLKFSWEEVHAVAEDLEHVSSRKLIDKLDEFLGFPRFDPHGDPIPDTEGRIKNNPQFSVTELELNTPALICQVSDQSKELLELLEHKQLRIGTKIEVKKRFRYDQSVEIKIRPGTKTQNTFMISEQLAKNIFVKHV